MELRRLVTPDGLTLHGIDNCVDSEIFVVHIHGKCGNFYQNEFIPHMMQRYASAKIRFAAFNHRGHDCLVENHLPGRIEYTGGAVEDMEGIRTDVAAIREYAADGASRVVLQGHSQGCEYALWHAIESPVPPELILLSPSDSRKLQERWIGGPLEEQARRLRTSTPSDRLELLPPEEYGVRSDFDYEIPTTASALIGILESDQISTFSFDSDWPHPKAVTSGFAYVGGSDPLRMHELSLTESGLRERVENLYFYTLADGDHHFHGHEDQVLSAIVNWLDA